MQCFVNNFYIFLKMDYLLYFQQKKEADARILHIGRCY